MTAERVDRRVLGAVRFVDAETGAEVEGPLRVDAPGLALTRVRRGVHAITGAPGSAFTAFAESFDAPPTIPVTRFTPVVADPSGRYAARRFTIDLPRSLAPNAEDSVFAPKVVHLYPTPTARPAPGSAVLRVSVATPTPRGVPGVLVRARARDGERRVLARGLSVRLGGSDRAEATIFVPGIRVMSWERRSDVETSQVISTSVEVEVDAIVDPRGVSSFDYVPDPDDLAARADLDPRAADSLAPQAAPAPVLLSSGRESFLPLAITLPADSLPPVTLEG
jgi:hypothetical protein